MSHKQIFAIIVAGGSGQRFGGSIPKQYLPLAGIPVLRHSINTFLQIMPARNIRVVIRPEDEEHYHRATTNLQLAPPAFCGKERKDSVFNGLKDYPDIKENDIVLIHDAARPLVTTQDINALIDAMKNERATSLAAPISDTLRYSDENACMSSDIKREHLYAIQTPQAFEYGILKTAHEKANPNTKFTDDTTLVSTTGIPVKLVTSKHSNFKITRPEDMTLAEQILSTDIQTEYRTGTGFDVHAFDEQEGIKSVRLCGIDVPHDRKLKGHSDADVGLHALTDAILGAIGEGDIGLHFPPSNMTYKNMDSAIFLKQAVDLTTQKGGRIVNVDITLICERPKLGEYRHAMRARVAGILEIEEDRVNIKATTTEKLGFTGRKEGIAAQATASICLRSKRSAA